MRAAISPVGFIYDRPMRLLQLVLLVLVSIAIYELLRARALGALREGLHRRARRFAEQHGVRVDLFKFGGKRLVKEELLNDLVIHGAMLTAAQAGERPEDVRRRVEKYVDEIVPAFSLSAYYQVGLKLAAAAVHAAYRPVIDRASRDRLRKLLPPDATAVFLINHRSNFDYVVVGWALARQVAVSYAVGEWARVFPLEVLFKAFGGFFVRRGFPDPLYHTVLRRYLQLITRQGVTQGIFPEGGLTRDGALRPPKVGLLEALLQLASQNAAATASEPAQAAARELYFVPVGINYDRVIEDAALLAESRGKSQPPTPAEKLRGALRLLLVVPARMLANLLRAATGRLHRFGYVAVAFGEPLRWTDLARARGIDLARFAAAPDEERRAIAKTVAVELMRQIARVIPATPVPLTARALLDLEKDGAVSEAQLASRVRELLATLDERGVFIARGAEFASTQEGRLALETDLSRTRDLARLEADLIALEEAERVVALGLEHLERRKLVQVTSSSVAIAPGAEARELLEYYARSLASLEDPSAPVTSPFRDESQLPVTKRSSV